MNNGLRDQDRNSLLEEHRDALLHWLRENQPVAIAVSGGIDSITLATAAQQWSTGEMFHAVSPAVPPEATTRVKELADQQDWKLKIFDAGEFEDAHYRANPVDRCFHCKTSLYSSIRRQTNLLVVSGTNLDDLGEYRPGLTAAKTFGVRHPYVEVGMTKSEVRSLARFFGLGSMAELPAAPCLASRVETGIRIEPAALAAIHAAEKLVTEFLGLQVVRCRLRSSAIVIELDRPALNALAPEAIAELSTRVSGQFAPIGIRLPVSFAPYRAGSAFLVS
jgi:pyridinium-3,5-biscarboxylic acid mononucleotide sulfurtransferase